MIFSAGIVAKGPHSEAGRALIRYFSTQNACAVTKQTAIDPVACASDRK
jgi:hypothetical protein